MHSVNGQLEKPVQSEPTAILNDIVIDMDGSITRDRSVWGFTVKQGGRTVLEDSGAHRVTVSSLTMEVEAVTHTIQWLASQSGAHITRHYSQRLNEPPAKGEPGMDCPDWHTTRHSLRLQRLLWIYSQGQTESVGMTGQIDWQANQISRLVCSLAGQSCL